MFNLPDGTTCLLLGVALHLLALRKGEWDLAVFKMLAAAAVGPFALAVWQTALHGVTFSSALHRSYYLGGTLISGIYLSMTVYRLWFHRLRRFPGPFLARISSFYITGVVFKGHQEYLELDRLHKKYGEVVRIGPSALSIADPQALHAVHLNPRCLKGPWYQVLAPDTSVQTDRDAASHGARRKVWDRGFSSKALRNYEPRVAHYSDKLLACVDSHVADGKARPLNASLWFNFYSFDVMGDLSLGESFGMLDRGESHFAMRTLHGFMFMIGVFSHVMWAFRVISNLPIVGAENVRFKAWVAEQVKKRIENPPEIPDVFSWIIEEYDSNPNRTEQERLNLTADGLTISIAGSDTTAAALSCLFVELATHPEVMEKLQTELDAFLQENSEPDAYALSKLKYLQACIDEGLRVMPVVPSGPQRVTPPEGLRISDNLFIPGDTIVQVPTYTLHRDERNFVCPNDFIPERWTSKPELIKNASVYSPFSIGPYNCVGKQLALMEIRKVTCSILCRYNVGLAPGQTKEAFVGGLVDGFTTACPKLDLVFTLRE
ncbi:hypothetical protein KVR01_006582 [Diaporthe batatas]|uniref:uncharacterized protein n=1 Tax=Diaporthe batatas TaxID=748121 RepID=UPI001D046C65|nr:uncharacterized protein KVR01_006582 [Diaporthe batatas]KAG8163285.1 hypothetical protein KVR01_006582 [Diaporthe batatas]